MTDKELSVLFEQKDESAIANTEREYGRYLHYIAYGILKSDEDANEIVNDAYLRAWENIPPVKPDPLKAYLARTVRNLALDRIEKINALKRAGGTLPFNELSDVLSSDSDPCDTLALREALDSFLRELPKEQRRVFICRYWYGKSIKDISSAFDLSESKTASMLLRIRGKLKTRLEKEGFLQ